MIKPLPSTEKIFLVIIILVALILLPDIILLRPPITYTVEITSIALFLILMIISTHNTFLTPRRCLGLLAYLLILMTPIEILLSTLFNVHGLMYTVAIPLTIILYVLALDSPILAATLSIMNITIPFILVWILLDNASITVLVAYIAATTLGALTTGAYLWKINKMKHSVNVKPLTLAKAFFTSWLMDDNEPIEEILEKLSTKTKVKVHGMYFKRSNGEDIALILPQIHYGPYRRVGSSAIPHQLYIKGREKGIHILALHGPGSHELNIASYKDAEKLVNNVISFLDEIEEHGIEVQPKIPKRITKNSWDIFILPFSGIDLVFVTRPSKGIDDLPVNLWNYTSSGEVRKLIVDSHNVMLKEPPTSNDLKELENIVKNITGNETPKEFKVGYGESIVNDPYNSLCLNKVVTLLLSYDEEKYTLVYLFGNNAEEGVRKSIRELTGKLGLRDLEVITPDDHVCAATIAFEPYLPVKYSKQLLEGTINSIKNALKDLKPAKTYYFELEVDNIHVLGDSVYKLLESLKHVGSYVSNTIKKKLALTYLTQILIMITIIVILLA